MTYVVIVESPAKIKKIGSILGSEYTVIASFGHFRDLPGKELSVDVEDNFRPTYGITNGKVVRELRSKCKNAKTVYIATDPDREGHGIAWHIAEVLNMKYPRVRRMMFREITKPAVLQSLQEADTNGRLDYNASYAYQARRIVDRLVGYKLSPQMWKNVQGAKSAGRVQSVTTRMVIDLENKIESHVPKEKYNITGSFSTKYEKQVDAKLHQVPSGHEEALQVLNICKDADFLVSDISSKKLLNSPPPAFKTSVYQQEASKRFGVSPNEAMKIAQKLYERGKITYHRTDTIHLSDVFKAQAEEYILKTYGIKYWGNHKIKKSKKKGEQAGHEAIRPTNVNEISLSGNFTSREKLIYTMIWTRSVASLMAKEQCNRITINISISTTKKYWFTANHTQTLFLGYKILFKQSDGEETNEVLLVIKQNDKLKYMNIVSKQTFSEAPKRYTEATLVKDLEKKGIGRPSTYASIVNTIQSRLYATKKKGTTKQIECTVDTLSSDKNIKTTISKVTVGDKKIRLYPTDLGKSVTQFLTKNMPNIMAYEFTSNLENDLDNIAQGNEIWTDVIKSVYDPLIKGISKIPQKTKEERKETRKKIKTERIIGEYEGEPLEYFNGKFGPFFKWSGKNYSLPKGRDDSSKVTIGECISIIKGQAKQNLMTHECTINGKSGKLCITKGPYGYYMRFTSDKEKPINFSFPYKMRQDMSAVSGLSLKKCLEYVEEAKKPKKPFKKYKKKD